MKKHVLLFIAGMTALALTGCSEAIEFQDGVHVIGGGEASSINMSRSFVSSSSAGARIITSSQFRAAVRTSPMSLKRRTSDRLADPSFNSAMNSIKGAQP